MFRIYFPSMFLLVAAGVVLAASAVSTSVLALGLVLLSIGAGGVSAGLMTLDTRRPALIPLNRTRKH